MIFIRHGSSRDKSVIVGGSPYFLHASMSGHYLTADTT